MCISHKSVRKFLSCWLSVYRDLKQVCIFKTNNGELNKRQNNTFENIECCYSLTLLCSFVCPSQNVFQQIAMIKMNSILVNYMCILAECSCTCNHIPSTAPPQPQIIFVLLTAHQQSIISSFYANFLTDYVLDRIDQQQKVMSLYNLSFISAEVRQYALFGL